MKTALHKHIGRLLLAGISACVAPLAWGQAGAVYYVCPGNVFTNTIGVKEAEQRGCKAREASLPTTIAGPKPRAAAAAAEPSSDRPAESRVAAAEQRARDSDAKLILQAELRKEEEALEALRREYNNGEPERRGDERNAVKYQERVAEMKAALMRKEADVAAIRRELGKLPS
jgi:flagellar biosynthesis GTPase FlhF